MGSCGPFVDAICDARCDYNQCSAEDKEVSCLARLEILQTSREVTKDDFLYLSSVERKQRIN